MGTRMWFALPPPARSLLRTSRRSVPDPFGLGWAYISQLRRQSTLPREAQLFYTVMVSQSQGVR